MTALIVLMIWLALGSYGAYLARQYFISEFGDADGLGFLFVVTVMMGAIGFFSALLFVGANRR